MDFFESQEAARRRSRWLVVQFIVAVVGVVFSVHAVVWLISQFVSGGIDSESGVPRLGASGFWDPELMVATVGATLVVILSGTGFKTLQLSSGGRVVAEDLGGRRIDSNTGDLDERRLVNVVEEMAIASGIPAPAVYLLEDEGAINAFAAGRSVDDAVIGVTRGTLLLLDRDELQGVVAHEFSHILNGDMRLNLRMIGLIHGILVLSLLGQFMLRGMTRVRFSSGDRDGKAGIAVLVAFLFALGILAIGSIGAFFARLIKSGVSRQREFLADAAAVQFTRNPAGIAGALKKIGGAAKGSRLQAPRAEEASHLFFANGLGRFSMARLFSTHPPLEERIRAIEPDWDGRFVQPTLRRLGERQMETREARPSRPVRLPGGAAAGVPGFSAGGRPGAGPPPLPGMGESLGESHLRRAREIAARLPAEAVAQARDRESAQELILALLISRADDVAGEELAAVARHVDPAAFRRIRESIRGLAGLMSGERIALIDLAIPALRGLSQAEYRRFAALIDVVVGADRKVDLFEFALGKMVVRHLEGFFLGQRPVPVRYRSLEPLGDEIALLLAAIAAVAGDDAASAASALAAGAGELSDEIGRLTPPAPGTSISLADLDAALGRLEMATPLVKKRILHACGRAVMADGRLRDAEAELVRAFADSMGVPIPPFVPAIDPHAGGARSA